MVSTHTACKSICTSVLPRITKCGQQHKLIKITITITISDIDCDNSDLRLSAPRSMAPKPTRKVIVATPASRSLVAEDNNSGENFDFAIPGDKDSGSEDDNASQPQTQPIQRSSKSKTSNKHNDIATFFTIIEVNGEKRRSCNLCTYVVYVMSCSSSHNALVVQILQAIS
jgi:hypothetical protein